MALFYAILTVTLLAAGTAPVAARPGEDAATPSPPPQATATAQAAYATATAQAFVAEAQAARAALETEPRTCQPGLLQKVLAALFIGVVGGIVVAAVVVFIGSCLIPLRRRIDGV